MNVDRPSQTRSFSLKPIPKVITLIEHPYPRIFCQLNGLDNYTEHKNFISVSGRIENFFEGEAIINPSTKVTLKGRVHCQNFAMKNRKQSN